MPEFSKGAQAPSSKPHSGPHKQGLRGATAIRGHLAPPGVLEDTGDIPDPLPEVMDTTSRGVTTRNTRDTATAAYILRGADRHSFPEDRLPPNPATTGDGRLYRISPTPPARPATGAEAATAEAAEGSPED